MYNYYKGNSGQMRRVEDFSSGEQSQAVRKSKDAERKSYPEIPKNPGKNPGLLNQLSSFFPGSLGKLETDDIILLLIFYLMYRESGDKELLIIMGALIFM